MWTVALETVDKRVIMHLARMNATRDVRACQTSALRPVQCWTHMWM